MKGQNNSITTQEGTVEGLTDLLAPSGGLVIPKPSQSVLAEPKKRGRPKGSKTRIQNKSASSSPTGKAAKEYEGVQEAYYKVVAGDDEVWYTDGFQALLAYEATTDGELYVGRKTSDLKRVR